MELFYELQNSFVKHKDRKAFYINDKSYTYECFSSSISRIRKAILQTTGNKEKNIGLIINDDLDTYAAIIALWFEGKAYVPINPDSPRERNNKIIAQADIKTMIDSSAEELYPELNVIMTGNLNDTPVNLTPKTTPDDDLAYIFFTSGTTGEPKGVPISRANVIGFIDAFRDMGLSINEEDRILQMFELTFDLSVMSYLVPLLYGSCVYTIPKNKIKYNYIYELMDEHNLTVALMVPSILHYLRQYFNEINVPSMKYSLFCGEALPLDVTDEWSRCLPNAEIYNVYGPTENTIFCTVYKYDRERKNKTHNGILSIGKAMSGVRTIIADEANNILPEGEKGELCLAGRLLTPGYWKNEAKNREAFFTVDYKGENLRFYRTGDLCVEDKDGDILYLGRIDFQTKIQGFRVELSEVEFHAKSILEKYNIVAVAYINSIGNTEIGMVIESDEFETKDFVEKLKMKLPSYMIPSKFLFLKSFPLNVNGKTDRKALQIKLETNK
jgi:D-alanine--poly(phosphoribitol) ligase subunit 1